MTKWENFTNEIDRVELICLYYKSLYGGNHGAGCFKSCPFREYGGQCKLDKMNKRQAEKFLDGDIEGE